jgi:hypothetical protein
MGPNILVLVVCKTNNNEIKLGISYQNIICGYLDASILDLLDLNEADKIFTLQ